MADYFKKQSGVSEDGNITPSQASNLNFEKKFNINNKINIDAINKEFTTS
jgi:hypothetical protein